MYYQVKERSAEVAVAYWQLVTILVLPHCLSFVRSAAVGVIGKTGRTHLWPKKGALIVVCPFHNPHYNVNGPQLYK